MGLDMYLLKKQDDSVAVGYWRKANQVHAWFVKNVQRGVDDCGQYPVPRHKMEELLSVCQRVLESATMEEGMVHRSSEFVNGVWVPIMRDGTVMVNPDVAQELLPTQEGFFFGGTDYDDAYVGDLEQTVKILQEALQEGGDYYYQASW